MHVYAHTYQDKELSFLEEDFCPGIAGLKAEMKQVLSSSEIINIEHDQLIAGWTALVICSKSLL